MSGKTKWPRAEAAVGCDFTDFAFECMCRSYPHEMHAEQPDRFVAYCQKVNPLLTRADVESYLSETDPKDRP